jgi:hypothetical protein
MPTAEEAQEAYKIAANIKNIILNKLRINDDEIIR